MSNADDTTTTTPAAAAAAEASQKFRLGDFAGAVALYTKAIQEQAQESDDNAASKEPNPVYYSNRAAAQVRLGNWADAVADAQRSIQLSDGGGTHVRGYNLLGTAYLAQKDYPAAIQAYHNGLQVAPQEESLQMGLQAARYAARQQQQASEAHQAVQRTVAARQSCTAWQDKARQATTASAFLLQSRRHIQLEMTALQSQLQLLDALQTMEETQKLHMLFSLLDTQHNGYIDASQLTAIQTQYSHSSTSLTQSIQQALQEAIAATVSQTQHKLDFPTFTHCLQVTQQALQPDMSLEELCEYLCVQLTWGDTGTGGGGGDAPQDSSNTAPVKTLPDVEQELYMDILRDPRMQQLFCLFDKKDGTTTELSFQQVAAGLYQLSHNMAEATRTTMSLLLTLDKNEERRTLDYEQFGRLVLSVVATSNASFDQVVDDLIFGLTTNEPIPESELQALYVADSMYEGVLELLHKEDTLKGLMDPLVYSRIQLLFDTWDTDHNEQISLSELLVGLQHYHEASHRAGNPEEEAAALLEFDQDGDHLLDRLDFARALGMFAQKTNQNLHELIDFMVVATTWDGNDPEKTQSYKRAYRHSISMDAAAMALRDIRNVEIDD